MTSSPVFLPAPTPAGCARAYVDRGIALVSMPFGEKGPVVKGWNLPPSESNPNGYVTSPDLAERTWQVPLNMGAVLGPSGWCTLDVDDQEKARDALRAIGIDLDHLLTDAVRIVGNPTNKAKAVFRVPAGYDLSTRKLVWPARKDGGKPVTVFELRAGPVQDVLPPSRHPSGKDYEWSSPWWENGGIPELISELLDLWLGWNELRPKMEAACPWRKIPTAPAIPPARVPTDNDVSASWDVLRAELRRRATVTDMLAEMGVEHRGGSKYLCPFHAESSPSFWVFHGDDGCERWCCAHGEAPVGIRTSTGNIVGDVVDLFRHKEGLSSVGEATVALARREGIDLPLDKRERTKPRLAIAPVAPPADAETEETAETSEETTQGVKSQGTKLVELLTNVNLFHSPDETPYAEIRRGKNLVVHAIRSKSFRSYLARLYWSSVGKIINSRGLTDGVEALAGKAIHDGPAIPVSLRRGPVGEAGIVIDIGDESWRAISVTPSGWAIVSRTETKIRRSPSACALPVPARGGTVNDLLRFLNLGKGPEAQARFILIVAWLLAALRPSGPYPILIFTSEQGSGKSVINRFLRTMVDNSSALLRSLPPTLRDLAAAVKNNAVLVFDNISYLSPEFSDAFCGLATGSAWTARSLYTDSDETIITASRPLILNGIEDIANRGDLLDRSIIIKLPSIPPSNRKTEADLLRDFSEAAPRILGALLDAVVVGLNNFPTTKLDTMPRMADFARWVVACEPALPWKAGAFLAAYAETQASAHVLAVDSSAVGRAILQLVPPGKSWTGCAKPLLAALCELVSEETRRSKTWPKQPNTLSGKIRRLAPNLRGLGMSVDYDGRDEDKKTIFVFSMPARGVAGSPPPVSTPPQGQMDLTPATTRLRPKTCSSCGLQTLPYDGKADECAACRDKRMTPAGDRRICVKCKQPRVAILKNGVCVLCDGKESSRVTVTPPEPVEEDDPTEGTPENDGEEDPF